MSTTHLETPDPDRPAIDVPDTIRSAESKLVYVFLAATDGATVDELHDALDLRKITLFPVLETLIEHDAIDHEGARYVPA
ncbi:TrmB family transcriptional regulator [Haloplanus pelagicus]|jgi:predicted transcriptional regulator|uniref:TrmB family transcriptional regulator n=1 Tax=Haloplanus pelagicus TaxID=2949995 RepID=UPI002040EA50|nr:TrmB family transcriptional regulator [Haloplanus sp. HW8-1]